MNDKNSILYIKSDHNLYELKEILDRKLILESIEEQPQIKIKYLDNLDVLKLDEISIFVFDEKNGEETVKLFDVFFKIKEKLNSKQIEVEFIKNSDEAKKLFEEILPNYERTKVTYFDMKKIYKWYNILIKFSKI